MQRGTNTGRISTLSRSRLHRILNRFRFQVPSRNHHPPSQEVVRDAAGELRGAVAARGTGGRSRAFSAHILLHPVPAHAGGRPRSSKFHFQNS
jgi:hypothetical protein